MMVFHISESQTTSITMIVYVFQVHFKAEMNYQPARPSQREKHGYPRTHLVSFIKDSGSLLSVIFQGTINMKNAFVESIFAFLATQQSDNGINT